MTRKQVEAPWTEDQVASLNAYQASGRGHPFTGTRRLDGTETILIATTAGWVANPGGPVVQTWAHDFMVDWSWDLSKRSPMAKPERDLYGKVIPSIDRVALIDLDGTVADYHAALTEAMALLRGPDEPPYSDRYSGGVEPPYIEARRKLIQRQSGFWRNLKPIQKGFQVVGFLREAGFSLHVLTKGPQKHGSAWSEKLEWCNIHLPDATVTVTGDKSLVYGRVLFDDYPPYFMSWLKVRPRGLVICLAHPWNEAFAPGGELAHPNVIRYDGGDSTKLCAAIQRAFERGPKEEL